ncbi:hypothetical protein MOQ07_11315 [Stenotrophomonas maltophilia]|nr:hypothetical protein [Stenotrophomonas maltophilia]MCI1087230.1 hypothetical protein [Stenotrophomonas maltophilia]MCI1115130.1 hypothetical protein [Stenotrophomonas maltophilia]
MKPTTAVVLSIFTVTCLVAGAGIYLSSKKKGEYPPTSENALEGGGREAQMPIPPSVEKLVADRKVSEGVVHPQIGRAFSISRSGPMRPPGNALDYVQSLIPASQSGDAAATYDIFTATLDCQNEFRNSGVMYQEIATNDSKVIPRDSSEDSRKNLLDCEGLLSSEELEKTNWLEKAAQQGSLEAMLMYSVNPDHILGDPREYALKPELVQKWKDDSMNYLNKAASLGSTDALYSLSDVFEQGVVAPQDPVEAYAYQLAARRVSISTNGQRTLPEPKTKLTNSQIQQATTRSDQIIKSCCMN